MGHDEEKECFASAGNRNYCCMLGSWRRRLFDTTVAYGLENYSPHMERGLSALFSDIECSTTQWQE